VRIGEIDVLVVRDGVLPLPTKMLGHNADPAARAAWLNDMFLPPDAFDWPLNVVVVSGGQTILIDAGLGLDPNLNLPRAGQLINRLEAAGIDLASVTDVVLTHMHMDHVGALLVEGVKGQLPPDLRIHVAAAEVKFWESPDFTHVYMPPGFPDVLRSTAKRFAEEYRSHLRLFENEHEVAPGVTVRRTGGHTPGHRWFAWRPAATARRSPATPFSRSGSTTRTGTTVSNTNEPRNRLTRTSAVTACVDHSSIIYLIDSAGKFRAILTADSTDAQIADGLHKLF
jgi:glyoxylase-like metal-dependent hydrolase (beta-lactamase superfamily II)